MFQPKALPLNRYKYSPIGKKLKAQTSAAEKQYRKLDKVVEFNKMEEKFLKRSAKSNLVCCKDFTFYKYHDINEFVTHSIDLKLNDSKEFKAKLELFSHNTDEVKPTNKEQIKEFKKRKVVLTAKLNMINLKKLIRKE